MKKAFLAMLLAGTICAVAQTTPSGDSMKHDKEAGKKETLTGCIVEKDGRYLLTNRRHPGGVELSTSEDLKSHVGHKVRVAGKMGSAMGGDEMGHDAMAKDDKMSHDAMAKDDKMGHDSMAKDDKMGHDAMGHGSATAFNVSKFEMLSATCESKK
jgi:pentapeptide MXKDX repeat protein